MTKSQDMSEAEAFEGFEPPQAQGLYDPAHEHDACGVGFIADLKGAQVAPDRRRRALDPRQPRAPRRRGRRPARRRRRRHPHPDPARLPQGRMQEARLHAARARPLRRRPHLHAAATSACARTASACGRASSARRAWSCSAGARCRSTTRRLSEMVKATEPVHRQVFIGRPSSDPRPGRLRARLYPDRARSSPTRSSRPTRTATSATTRCRCRAARSSTRACSCRIR